jgi:ABC-type nitrate/sulfonate/bicarbonate transport system substrate-binding protein
VLRAWAADNAETLVAYLAAAIGGLRWSLDPANRTAAIGLYADRLNLSADMAAETYAIAVDPVNGLARDAAFDLEGLKTVLRLRAASEGGSASPPEKYFDLTWHSRARRTITPAIPP